MASFFLGPLIEPGGFGFSRWLSAFIDTVGLPVLFALLIGFLLSRIPLLSGGVSLVNFALLWLIPVALMRTITWGIRKDPLHLVLVPLLWTALATGIPVLLRLLPGRRGIKFFPLLAALVFLPLTAATSYWAFFSQKFYPGLFFLIITLSPLAIKTVALFITKRRSPL